MADRSLCSFCLAKLLIFEVSIDLRPFLLLPFSAWFFLYAVCRGDVLLVAGHFLGKRAVLYVVVVLVCSWESGAQGVLLGHLDFAFV